MGAKGFGLILLLVLSVLFGIGLGEYFFRLFIKAIPPMAISNFNQGTAHILFTTSGAGAGVVIAIWSLLAILISKLFKSAPKPKA
jgi:hypothetical protein